MAIGKGSKKKKGKGGRKKQIDPMSRKDWVTLTLAQYKGGALRPNSMHKGSWTVVNRSSGTVLATTSLLGRQFEIRADDKDRNMTIDEHNDSTLNNFVLKYKVVAVKEDEKACVCLPCGIRPAKGFLGFQMKKRHTTIDACVDFKTADGYLVRVMVKAITKRLTPYSVKTSAYAKSSQVKLIREKLKEVVKEECSKKVLSVIVNDMSAPRSLSDALEQATVPIYPLAQEFMFWLRILKEPQIKFKYEMLLEQEEDEMEEVSQEDAGAEVDEVEQ